mmetsp:Transcript_1726/g.4321  ORF Transcript_1726/g.4321 Transcript_1726/m.4321 type:complete len:222 (+) Transcript_1726:758-1423(+)
MCCIARATSLRRWRKLTTPLSSTGAARSIFARPLQSSLLRRPRPRKRKPRCPSWGALARRRLATRADACRQAATRAAPAPRSFRTATCGTRISPTPPPHFQCARRTSPARPRRFTRNGTRCVVRSSRLRSCPPTRRCRRRRSPRRTGKGPSPWTFDPSSARPPRCRLLHVVLSRLRLHVLQVDQMSSQAIRSGTASRLRLGSTLCLPQRGTGEPLSKSRTS